MVQIAVSRSSELESAEADIIQSLVINAVGLVGVLDKLVDRQGGVVGLDDSVGHLGRRDNRKGAHDTIRVLLADLGDEESAHARASAATERVGKLEALKAVAALSLLADNVQNGVDELSALCVVALGPVVAGTALSEHKVVGTEQLAERARADRVHSTGLKIDKDGARHILAASGLVVVNVDTLQLEIRVAVVCAGGVDAVLIRNDFPELGTDLVTALAGLEVDNLKPIRLNSWKRFKWF